MKSEKIQHQTNTCSINIVISKHLAYAFLKEVNKCIRISITHIYRRNMYTNQKF